VLKSAKQTHKVNNTMRLYEITDTQQLDEGPISKALATAALSLGLSFGNQVNAEEVFIYKDAQGKLQTVQQLNQVPSNMSYFTVNTDDETVKSNQVGDEPKTAKEIQNDASHISSRSWTKGIDAEPVNAHSVQSNNMVHMAFPYKLHKGTLSLRGYDGNSQPQIHLNVSGQITGERVKIKIDNLPTITTGIQGKSDDNSFIKIGLIGTYIIGNNRSLPEKDWYAFMDDKEIKAYEYYKSKIRNTADDNWSAMMSVATQAIQRNLFNAKQLKIEVDLYNSPRTVYEFNVSNLFMRVDYKTDYRKDNNKFMKDNPAPPTNNEKLGITVSASSSGITVKSINDESPAMNKLQPGDIITGLRYKGKNIKDDDLTSAQDFKTELNALKGKKIVFQGVRNGKQFMVVVKL